MGNRATITSKNRQIGIYVHWNGGPESICCFLTYAKLKEVRNPNHDQSYGFARLVQIIGNFFGGELSIGVDVLENLDHCEYDNGVYIVDEKWNVIDRSSHSAPGTRRSRAWMVEGLRQIDRSMPEHLPPEKLEQAEFVDVPELTITEVEI